MKNFDQVKHLETTMEMCKEKVIYTKTMKAKGLPQYSGNTGKKELEVTERLVQLQENMEGLKTMHGSNKKKLNGETKEVTKSNVFLFLATQFFY